MPLVLAGCTGGGGSAQGPRATASAPASPGAQPTEAATSPAEPSPAEEQVLRVAVREPTTLDPMRIQDPGAMLVVQQLFEGLTRWDARRERVVPAAASSWKVTDRARKFTFKLNKGLTFHDGSKVSSDDFAFAFDRIARKRSASDLAYTLERIRGFDAVNDAGRRAHLSGIKTPDDRTLVIELSQPFRDFPAVLTHPGLVPVPRKAVQDAGRFLLKPIGNGPFEMARRWVAGKPIKLDAFEDFQRPPAIDGMRFVPYTDAALSWLDFRDGTIDVTEVPAGSVASAARQYGDRGFKPFLAGYYYGLNVRSKALRDIRLRRAISRAIDRRRIATDVYNETMREPRGIVPAGMPGFNTNVCGSLCRHSRPAAKRLVSKLPRKARQVVIQYTRGEPHTEVARAVRDDLTAAGLDVELKDYSFSRYLRLLRAGDQAMYRLGWIAEYPSPDVFLSSLFDSDSGDNHAGFSSRRADSLLARARAARPNKRRVRLYRKAEKVILRRLPIVPIGSFVMRWAAQPWVNGIEFDVMGRFDAAGISIERD